MAQASDFPPRLASSTVPATSITFTQRGEWWGKSHVHVLSNDFEFLKIRSYNKISIFVLELLSKINIRINDYQGVVKFSDQGKTYSLDKRDLEKTFQARNKTFSVSILDNTCVDSSATIKGALLHLISLQSSSVLYPSVTAENIRLVFNNGSSFEGKVEGNYIEGHGKYFFPSSDERESIKCNFSRFMIDRNLGILPSNLAEEGIITYRDSSIYTGKTKNGKPFGIGSFTFPSSNEILSVEVEFSENRFSYVRATINYRDGSQYVGPVHEYSPCGDGVLKLANGVRIECVFSGKTQWKGYLRFFEQDKLSPFYVRENGSDNALFFFDKEDKLFTLKGKFDYDLTNLPTFPLNRFPAEGTVEYRNGKTYIGPLVEGRPHGVGKYQFSDTTSYKGYFTGEFSAGEYPLFAKVEFSNGWVCEDVLIKKGLPDLKTLVNTSSGDRFRGVFHDSSLPIEGTYFYNVEGSPFTLLEQDRFRWKNTLDKGDKWRIFKGELNEGKPTIGSLEIVQDGIRLFCRVNGNVYNQITYSFGQFKDLEYIGDHHQGIPHGQGTLVTRAGITYSGTFVDGKFEGEVESFNPYDNVVMTRYLYKSGIQSEFIESESLVSPASRMDMLPISVSETIIAAMLGNEKNILTAACAKIKKHLYYSDKLKESDVADLSLLPFHELVAWLLWKNSKVIITTREDFTKDQIDYLLKKFESTCFVTESITKQKAANIGREMSWQMFRENITWSRR